MYIFSFYRLSGFLTSDCFCMMSNSFSFFFSFIFLGLHLYHVEVPRLGTESELHLPAYTTTTATQDSSRLFDLRQGVQQRQTLNPLSDWPTDFLSSFSLPPSSFPPSFLPSPSPLSLPLPLFSSSLHLLLSLHLSLLITFLVLFFLLFLSTLGLHPLKQGHWSPEVSFHPALRPLCLLPSLFGV